MRVRLRGRVREAGGAVAIELQGGGVAAAGLGREVTVVVSGMDGLARRLVLGVRRRVHEVRAHRRGGGDPGPDEGGPGRAARGGLERALAQPHSRGDLGAAARVARAAQ